MPKFQFYVSEDLKGRVRDKDLDVTKICQDALEAATADKGSNRARFLEIRRLLREIEQNPS